jgi:hypothetical protein
MGGGGFVATAILLCTGGGLGITAGIGFGGGTTFGGGGGVGRGRVVSVACVTCICGAAGWGVGLVANHTQRLPARPVTMRAASNVARGKPSSGASHSGKCCSAMAYTYNFLQHAALRACASGRGIRQYGRIILAKTMPPFFAHNFCVQGASHGAAHKISSVHPLGVFQ